MVWLMMAGVSHTCGQPEYSVRMKYKSIRHRPPDRARPPYGQSQARSGFPDPTGPFL